MNTYTIMLIVCSWPHRDQFVTEHNHSKNILLLFNILRVLGFGLLSVPTLNLLFDTSQSGGYRLFELILYIIAVYMIIKKIRITLSVSKRKKI